MHKQKQQKVEVSQLEKQCQLLPGTQGGHLCCPLRPGVCLVITETWGQAPNHWGLWPLCTCHVQRGHQLWANSWPVADCALSCPFYMFNITTIQVSPSLYEKSVPSIPSAQDHRMMGGEERLGRAGRVAAPAVLGAPIGGGECPSSKPVGKLVCPQRFTVERAFPCRRPLSPAVLRSPTPALTSCTGFVTLICNSPSPLCASASTEQLLQGRAIYICMFLFPHGMA